MAYPFYYQPYYQPTPQMPQNQQASGIIWVSGLVEAQSYPVAPNCAVALWEQSGKTIYLKSADATGKPSLRIYDLVERTETPQTMQGVPDDKNVIYAKKDDLEAVLGVIKGLSSDIETMKGDLYGLSGKRKTAKKEVTDDDA